MLQVQEVYHSGFGGMDFSGYLAGYVQQHQMTGGILRHLEQRQPERRKILRRFWSITGWKLVRLYLTKTERGNSPNGSRRFEQQSRTPMLPLMQEARKIQPESSGTGNVIDAVFEKESDRQVSIDDFLVLMVEQLKTRIL